MSFVLKLYLLIIVYQLYMNTLRLVGTWVCVRFYIRSWKPGGKWSVSYDLTPFPFSHGCVISLCHLFPLKSAPHTALPTNQLTPASCRHHRHLASILFKLYQLNKKLFKRITKAHRVMFMGLNTTVVFMVSLNPPASIFSHAAWWFLSLSQQTLSRSSFSSLHRVCAHVRMGPQ